ncbi:MAG: hypothetical protein QM770_03300 [Tepidisphaeraceae bacterium]
MISYLGEPLVLDGEDTRSLRVQIATVFPRARTIVTVPGVHCTQYLAYGAHLSELAVARGERPWTDDECLNVREEAVDLLADGDILLIRPDPTRMDLAFEADELLQEILPKQRIRFLYASDERVRDAIRRRGEAWRINPLPRSLGEMVKLIAASRVAVHGRPIYYYNAIHGTRLLTYMEFAALGVLPTEELHAHLAEIAEMTERRNVRGYPEMRFFTAGGPSFTAPELSAAPISTLDAEGLRALHRQVADRFAAAVPPALRRDDVESATWRNRMYGAIVAHLDDTCTDRDLLGLGEDYFMQVQWLPGVRIEQGEIMADAVQCSDRAKARSCTGSSATFSAKPATSNTSTLATSPPPCHAASQARRAGATCTSPSTACAAGSRITCR